MARADSSARCALGALFLAFFLCAAPVAQAGLIFGAPSYLPAGPGPRVVTLVDLDRDGAPDLLVLNDSTSVVTVFSGSGGMFSAPVTYPTGLFPVAMAMVDFDADGDLDMVTADSLGNTASVLYGAEGLSFEPPYSLPTGAGPCAVTISPGFWGVAPGFETANASGTLTHFEANGEREFFWRTEGDAGTNPCAVVSADIDWDREGDAIVANGVPGADPGQLTLLFAEYEYYERYYYYETSELAAAAVPRAMAMGEFLNSGWLDLMVGSSGPEGATISIYPGDGVTPFGQPVTFDAGPPLSTFVLADMDLDEVPDIVTAGPTGTVAVLRNTGSGFVLDSVVSLGEPVTSVAVAVLNSDDWPDIVVALHESRRVAVLHGGGEVTTAPDIAPTPRLTLRAAPLPASGSTEIRFELPGEGEATVLVRDIAGRVVRRLDAGRYPAGERRVTWDLRGDGGIRVAAGVYFVTLSFGGEARSTRIVVMP